MLLEDRMQLQKRDASIQVLKKKKRKKRKIGKKKEYDKRVCKEMKKKVLDFVLNFLLVYFGV